MGQFDVVVDGVTIASKKTGLLTKLLGGGWPDPDEVVAAIEKRTAKR